MDEVSGRWDRRNFNLNIIEGALYTTGTSLISAQTVLPVIVTRFGGGNIAVGALAVIIWGGTFLPQIFAARYGQTLHWKKPWVVRLGALQRLIILFISGIFLLPDNPGSPLRLALFLIFFTCNQVILGITSPLWYDFFAKLVRPKKRGRSVGFRSALGGILSIGGTIYLTVILEKFPFPTNFFIIFVTAFAFELSSIILQAMMVEDYPSSVQNLQTFRSYFIQLRAILKGDSRLRHFLIATSFLILATVPIAFFIIYALRQYHLDESVIGEFTFIMVWGQIFGAIAVGYIADHYSSKTALIVTASSLLTASILALVSPSLVWYRLVFYFLGLNTGSETLIRYNFVAEYCQPELRTIYIGLTNSLLTPFYFAALLGGFVIDILGYSAIFVIGAACSVIGLLYFVVLVREPINR